MSDTAATPEAEANRVAPVSQSGNPPVPAPGTEPGDGRMRRIVLVVLLVLVVVGLALLIAFFDAVRHWVALHTGIVNGGPDHYYNFWSGFGSDLGEATLITAVAVGVYTGVRKVNCHTKGCWRIGHHVLEGTPYILCRHHHPGVPTAGATHAHILEEHRRFKEAIEARRAPQRS